MISKVTWQVVKVKPGDGSKFILTSSGTLNEDKREVAINEDMIRVDVTTTSGQKQTDFHLKISPKPDVLTRPAKKGLASVNVIMIGLDSTAHSHFQRKLGQVYEFLKNDLKSFIFNGYSIVGDGTTPALLALLTGRKEEELPEGRHRYNQRFLNHYYLFISLEINGGGGGGGYKLRNICPTLLNVVGLAFLLFT